MIQGKIPIWVYVLPNMLSPDRADCQHTTVECARVEAPGTWFVVVERRVETIAAAADHRAAAAAVDVVAVEDEEVPVARSKSYAHWGCMEVRSDCEARLALLRQVAVEFADYMLVASLSQEGRLESNLDRACSKAGLGTSLDESLTIEMQTWIPRSATRVPS